MLETVPASETMTHIPSATAIRLRGVRVHNLKSIDLDLQRGQLIVFCGVSGSGKSSLALDTLYAEGQRRYIESFSAYTRQFLQRLDKPDCEMIRGIPPAIAVTRAGGSRGNRSTVATATEIADHLRLLFAKIARLFCHRCGREVEIHDPQSIAMALQQEQPSRRMLLVFEVVLGQRSEAVETLEVLQQQGFVRLIVGDQTFRLSDNDRSALAKALPPEGATAMVVVDRVRTNDPLERLTESLEAAMTAGLGKVVALIQAEPADNVQTDVVTIDQSPWQLRRFSRTYRCEYCALEFPLPQPGLFHFNNPLGACPTCEGFGEQVGIDMNLVVPDPGKSLREGAIAPWNTPSYRHEWDELVALADESAIPLDVPFQDLPADALEKVENGIPARAFGGVRGFFDWLERRKYKMSTRIFLARYRSYTRCQGCEGRRLRDEALAFQVDGHNIAQISAMSVDQAKAFFDAPNLSQRQHGIAAEMLRQIRTRLGFLQSVGLGYLQLERPLRTLSGGETQRVALTGALGSSLVNMLYVLDEPTAGLHPEDVQRLIDSIWQLRSRGNTVVIVEHHPLMIHRADQVVEIGPEAGSAGGEIVFQGTPEQLVQSSRSITADFLTGRRGGTMISQRRRQPAGWVELRQARGNNLQNIDVRFPLGVLCLVTGVSGSGKSSLVHDTLYGAAARRKGHSKPPATLAYDDLLGIGQVDDVQMIDQAPVSGSTRSIPATFVNAMDPIRKLFAQTIDARTRNFTASHFSFNNEIGQCPHCQGDGVQLIDMQFLADISMTCPTCEGKRYRPEVLAVRYRDRNIAECLQMTIRQASGFFRGQPKIQQKLQPMIDVGLGYLQLGQAANTLSSGESQRLKLAAFLTGAKRRKTLFLLDEPTIGLHFADIVRLLDCFTTLLDEGHSLIVVEHNLQLMAAADYLIDIGPGASAAGGRVIATGTPEEIAVTSHSATGRALATWLEKPFVPNSPSHDK